MKRLRELKNQLLSGLIMLSISIPLLLIAFSIGSQQPVLSFEGVTMEMQEGGDVQLQVKVSIKNVALSNALPIGARFQLIYNTEYLVPSRQDNNEALKNGENADLAFRFAPGLYREQENGEWVSKDPFLREVDKNWNQNIVGEKEGTLSLSLTADRNITPASGSGMHSVRSGMTALNVFDVADEIVLGTLSFRVEKENLDKLPEIKENFDHILGLEDPKGKNGKYLIQNKDLKVETWQAGSWAIVVAYDPSKGAGIYSQGYLDNSKTAEEYSAPGSSMGSYLNYKPYAESHFTFDFPRIVIGVEAAEAELTIDAYQAYTDGHITDLDVALQKYSPAVLVKYSDGTQENVIFPWGKTVAPWSTSEVTEWGTTNIVTDANYDCTRGDYKIQKKYCYTDDMGEERVFPIPVSVHMRVTPITLVDVTADDLYRVYPLKNELVLPGGVQSRGDLDLPEEARLVTDVPAGGATLTMQIPGWSHINVSVDDPNGPVYWPSAASGTDMENLWKDGATTADGGYLRWPVNSDLSLLANDDWGTTDTNGRPVGENRAGLYTFHMAGAYGNTPVPGFERTDIKAAYPWLTVPDNHETDDVEIWPLDDALRRIVWNGDTSDKNLVDKLYYEVTYESTVTDYTTNRELLLPNLTLQVKKHNEGGGAGDLPATTVFRIKLPDGTEIGIGKTGDVDTGDWFDPANGDSGSYINVRRNVATPGNPESNLFDLIFNPGRTDAGDHAAQRERLLRYINLGGWFSVSVNEDPDAYYWSDFIPVYVEPRTNVHLEDKVYNFVGVNAALYQFVNVGTKASPMIPATVTLPAGSYEVVDSVGQPIYDDILDESGLPTGDTVRREERYGAKVLYSGVTGSQFGEINTFSIEPASWSRSADGSTAADGKPITRYGANEFKHDARYGIYNWIHNPGIKLISETEQREDWYYNATIRTQGELKEPEDPNDPDQLKEGITLTYEGPPGGVTDGPDGNVDLVTFDTRVEGYTVRQEYTLIITNIGDVDIYGLAIDLETDLPNIGNYGAEGGHFTLLKPPASFLPAGERTTFTLSYVYDLRAQGNGGELEYLDKLFITSDKKHTVGPGTREGTDYLLDFDAKFTVTGNKIHRVWVEYEPSDGYMGTAQVIVGETPVGSGNMNINAGSNAAAMNTTVYVMATPTDEYEVETYSAKDSTGAVVGLVAYTGPITLADGTTINIDSDSQIRIWSFTMPDYDVTVRIKFYEPISSKLRLSNLTTYADEDAGNLYIDDPQDPRPNPDRVNYEYIVWQKSFTKEEYQGAEDCRPDPVDPSRLPTDEEKGRFLMSRGTAVKKGFVDSVDQYLVVIPYEADYAQVEATLRQVLYPRDGSGNLPQGANDSITVEMTLYPEKQDPFTCATQQVYIGNDGNTATPTVHTSRAFDSPTPGESNYVQVRITYSSLTETVSRYYYVEIHRVPREPVAELNYGNSPYGMIMNAANIAAADKAAAKTAFVNNKYSFGGLADSLVPKAVTDAAAKSADRGSNALIPFDKLHYWTEAWVAPDAAYEPESRMGFLYIYSSAEKKWTWVPDPNIYKEADNLDLNDYAFFAILGEDFLDPGLRRVLDSTGRPADISRAVISLEVYTLDTDASTQLERFALPADPEGSGLTADEQVALADRTIILSRQTKAGSLVEEWSELSHTHGRNLRPGRYQLVYTLPDFDYDDYIATTEPEDRDPNRAVLKVTRDFVVLAPVGDVNADVQNGGQNVSDHVDELLMKDRVTEPLGYMADYYPDGAIFKLRTCDVNNDRNINNIDANTIRVKKGIERFYLPIDYK